MDLAHMPTAPMRWWVLRSTNTGCNHTGSLRGFKTTASSCGDSHGPYYTLHSVTAALPASTRNLDHRRRPDNKLHRQSRQGIYTSSAGHSIKEEADQRTSRQLLIINPTHPAGSRTETHHSYPTASVPAHTSLTTIASRTRIRTTSR